MFKFREIIRGLFQQFSKQVSNELKIAICRDGVEEIKKKNKERSIGNYGEVIC